METQPRLASRPLKAGVLAMEPQGAGITFRIADHPGAIVWWLRHRMEGTGGCGRTGFQLRRDFPDNTVAMGSTLRRGAVQIATRVNQRTPVRSSSVGTAAKVVKVGLRPTTAGRRQLENRTCSVGAIFGRGAVQIACRVHHQAVIGPRQVARPSEAVNHAECPTAAGGYQLVNCAAAIRPAATGGSN